VGATVAELGAAAFVGHEFELITATVPVEHLSKLDHADASGIGPRASGPSQA
jgi:hypothetical protein